MIRRQFAQETQSTTDGHMLTFLANSGTKMTNGLTVDLDTLQIPLADGSLALIDDLTDDSQLTIPLLVDHMPSVDSQAGTVTKIWRDSDGLQAQARLSDVAEGQKVQQLAKDGALTNSFSITIDCATEPDSDGILRNSELVEISVVYRGADSKAVFRSLNSRKENTMVKIDTDKIGETVNSFNLAPDEADKLNTAIKQAFDAAESQVSKAVSGVTEGNTDDNDPDKTGDDTPAAPKAEPQQPAQSSNARSAGARTVIINSANPNVHSGFARVNNSRETYLDSDKAYADFARNLVTSKNENPDEVRDRWNTFARKQLALDASITADDADKLIPKAVTTKIDDALNTNGSGLWQLLNHTGIDVAPKLTENTVGLRGDGGRAHGYAEADYGTEKKMEHVALKERELTTDLIYKRVSVPRGWLRKTQNPVNLLNYFLQEMPNRMVNTVERSTVSNNVTGPNPDTDWADMKMFRSLWDDSNDTGTTTEIAGNEFAQTFAYDPDEMSLMEAFRRASGKVRAAGQKVLVCSADTAAEIQWAKDKNGGLLLPLGGSVESAVGVTRIITPEWWQPEDDERAYGYVFTPNNYALYGDTSSSSFADFSLQTNTDELLEEMLSGGGLTTIKSACVVRNAGDIPQEPSEAPAGTRSAKATK